MIGSKCFGAPDHSRDSRAATGILGRLAGVQLIERTFHGEH